MSEFPPRTPPLKGHFPQRNRIIRGLSLAVVIAISAFGVATPSGYVWFAFLGALAGSVLVYAIGSSGRGGATPVTRAAASSLVSSARA